MVNPAKKVGQTNRPSAGHWFQIPWVDDAFQTPRRASRSSLRNLTSSRNVWHVPTTHELMELTATSDSKTVVCWGVSRVDELLEPSMRRGLAADTSQPRQTLAAT